LPAGATDAFFRAVAGVVFRARDAAVRDVDRLALRGAGAVGFAARAAVPVRVVFVAPSPGVPPARISSARRTMRSNI
jgi:hypothetical protein